MTRRGRVVEMFAGGGGLSLGTEQAGFDIELAVDNEPANVATHGAMFSYGRHAVMDLYEDRSRDMKRLLCGTDVDALTMGRTPDAVVGGPPCQGISNQGNRDPNDPRNRLMDSFIRHLIELGPAYGVMEQVPTLLEKQNEHLLDGIREKLRRGGYSMVDPKVLRAIDFGVPQRRERVFLLIHREDVAAPEYPQPTHGEGDDLWLKPTPTVRDALDGLPDACQFDELWERDWVEAPHTPPTSWYGRVMRGLENDPHDLGYRRAWNPGILTCSQRTRHEAESVERFLSARPGSSEPISKRHRLDPDGLALTLRAGSDSSKGSFTAVVPIHPKGTRVITVREGARLHSLPDWYLLSRSKIQAYRQLGNSVPPLLGRAILGQVTKALGLAPPAPNDVVEIGKEEIRQAA